MVLAMHKARDFQKSGPSLMIQECSYSSTFFGREQPLLGQPKVQVCHLETACFLSKAASLVSKQGHEASQGFKSVS